MTAERRRSEISKLKFIDIHCLIDHNPDAIADLAGPDEDGHLILASMKHEPDGWPVEVLIEPDVAPAEAAVILRKMADWVAASPLMSEESIRDMTTELHRSEEGKRRERRRKTEKAMNYELDR